MRPSALITTFCCPPLLIRSLTVVIAIGASTPSIHPTPRPWPKSAFKSCSRTLTRTVAGAPPMVGASPAREATSRITARTSWRRWSGVRSSRSSSACSRADSRSPAASSSSVWKATGADFGDRYASKRRRSLPAISGINDPDTGTMPSRSRPSRIPRAVMAWSSGRDPSGARTAFQTEACSRISSADAGTGSPHWCRSPRRRVRSRRPAPSPGRCTAASASTR